MSRNAPPNDILVRAVGLSRRYESAATAAPAVSGVSLTIRAGDRIALTGRSGSGKSTLLHLIAGLDEPSAGTIEWPGLGQRDDLRPKRLAIMMQSPSLIPWLDITENVALALQLAGGGEGTAQEAALQALEAFGLAELGVKLPEQVSGGQAQRVALVRAIVNSPVLLLADEPTGQLDHTTGRALLDALFAWADRTGAAILIATHDPAVADRFPISLSMHQGRLEQSMESVA